MAGNEVEIVVTATDKTKAAIDGTKSRLGGLDGAFRNVATTAAGFLSANVIQSGATAVMGFLSDSTGLASDLAESGSKVDTVFGEAAGGIHAFAKDAATSLGLSEQAALDMAGSFGNMFVQLGVGQQEASSMSQVMGGLAADFASFHNADISEVLEAQSAAFRGEYDSVQKFLPLLNAAAVDQKALAMTGKEATDELTAQEKALAVYELMLEGAGDAQGDFARTADGAANSERIAAAEMENAQAAIGQKLMPVTKALTEAKLRLAGALVDTVLPALQGLGRWISENKELLAAIAIGIVAALVPAFVSWAVAAGSAALATLLAAAPLILLGAAIAALAFLVITHWDTIKAATAAVFGFIQETISAVITWISENWPLLLAILTGPIGLAAYFIASNWESIKGGASAVKDWIVGRFNDLVSFLTGIPGAISTAVSGMWDGITSGFKSAINTVIGWWNGLTFPSLTLPSVDPLGSFGPSIGGGTFGGWSLPDIPYLAHGGIGSGLAVVGEHGRELVDLGPSSRVYGNSMTEQMLGGGGGQQPLVIDVRGSSAELIALIQSWIRATSGGDVQAALGAS